MTPCPSPAPPGNPGHPVDSVEEERERARMGEAIKKTEKKVKHEFVRVHALFSNLIRVHEELDELTADHSEFSGL